MASTLRSTPRGAGRRHAPRRGGSAQAPPARSAAPDPVRLAAARAYLTFLRGGPFLDAAPPELTADADRRLYAQLLYTAVRHRRALEAQLERLARRPLARIDAELLAVATLGLAQLRHLERVPPHAAINESVKLAGALHRAHGRGWVNAVLRAATREAAPPDDALPLAVRTSHPDWLVSRWVRRYGEARTAELCAANNHHGGVTLRVNAARTDARALAARLAAEGVECAPDPLWPAALHVERAGALLATGAFAEGLCYVQDVSSQLLGAWIAPLVHGPVLDAAAAPGGKLLHAMALAGGPLGSVALDADAAGLARLRENAVRLGLPCPVLLRGDGRALPFAGGAAGRGFATVLLDVPCSATGTIRKHPELKWRKFEHDLPPYAAKQAALLDEAARVLAPGGLLVYSTCSLEPEENEAQVAAFLARRAGFTRVALAALAPPVGLSAPLDELLTPAGDLLLLPTRWRMGLFAALLRRDGPAPAGNGSAAPAP